LRGRQLKRMRRRCVKSDMFRKLSIFQNIRKILDNSCTMSVVVSINHPSPCDRQHPLSLREEDLLPRELFVMLDGVPVKESPQF
jgi:hypothetical protein